MPDNQKDLVLAPNQYAYIQDNTKGSINTWFGPVKVSLSNTDEPVYFSERSKKFETCSLEEAKHLTIVCPENWYVSLKNPTKDGRHPIPKQSNDFVDLDIGRKVNIVGPTSFALYPGQISKVVRGHMLRSNQYLLVRVYDAESAKENWDSAIITPITETKPVVQAAIGTRQQAEAAKAAAVSTVDKMSKDLTVGQVMVIKGTEVSFYIPPTGIEVLADGSKTTETYVREAVTLERLEYCILKDEDGNKRYVQGPAVVFPEPTEMFLTKDNEVKFKAYELNENSGVYVKVIAPYKEGTTEYKAGEELFITGKETAIYFPRAEHGIISYNNNKVINYAIAIPEGEGRYVLNKNSGEVQMIVGPRMFLPDPRTEVVVKRVLTDSQCDLWYPDNDKVRDHNRTLRREQEASTNGYVTGNILSESDINTMLCSMNSTDSSAMYSTNRSMTSKAITRNADISRSNEFTKPRTITLQNSEYDGVVSLDIWSGYAVKVVSKSGEAKVINGPQTYLLGYNETLEQLELSTGKPKTTDTLFRTVYLRTKNNKVGDIVKVETKDFCEIDIKLFYNVNFEASTPEEMNKWFDADNYIKLLCDRMKSMIRRSVKKLTVNEFYTNASDIIRQIVLNVDENDQSLNENGKVGRLFTENNMFVFDVEVTMVKLTNREINEMFEECETGTIRTELELVEAEKRSKLIAKLAEYKSLEDQLNHKTRMEALDLAKNLNTKQAEINAEKLKLDSSYKEEQLKMAEIAATQELTNEKIQREIAAQGIKQELDRNKQLLDIEKEKINVRTQAFVDKMTAVAPELVAALTSLSQTGNVADIVKSIAPYALASEDESVSDVVKKLLKNNDIESILSVFTKE